MKWLGYPTLLAHDPSQGSGASSIWRNQARWIMASRSGPVPMYSICGTLATAGLDSMCAHVPLLPQTSRCTARGQHHCPLYEPNSSVYLHVIASLLWQIVVRLRVGSRRLPPWHLMVNHLSSFQDLKIRRVRVQFLSRRSASLSSIMISLASLTCPSTL